MSGTPAVRDLFEPGITVPGEFDRTECVPDKPCRLLQILRKRDWSLAQSRSQTADCTAPLPDTNHPLAVARTRIRQSATY